MLDRLLTPSQANQKIQKLVGMPVSLPWKGYGSAIFFELGALSPGRTPRHHPKGEAKIYIDWDWRVEQGAKVLFGSSNSRPVIERGIQGFCLTKISAIAIAGEVPELLIEFSNGQRLISAAMRPEGSEWAISFDGKYLSAEGGVLSLGEGSGVGLTPVEEAAFEHAHQTAKRWGTPIAEPKGGACRDCKWMRYIDGDADFLDYGVCTCPDSPFDARVVNIKSGCPAFSPGSVC